MKNALLVLIIVFLFSACKESGGKGTDCTGNCGSNPGGGSTAPTIKINALSCDGSDRAKIGEGDFNLTSLIPAAGKVSKETSEILLAFTDKIDALSIATMTAALKDSTLLMCEAQNSGEFCSKQELISASVVNDGNGIKINFLNGSLRPGTKYFLRVSPALKALTGGIFGCKNDIEFWTEPDSIGVDPVEPPVNFGPFHIVANQDITVKWKRPNSRENGVPLDVSELGGYEIRYKKTTDTEFNYVIVDDGYLDQKMLKIRDEGEYIFEVAAYDKNGLYSRFVLVNVLF